MSKTDQMKELFRNKKYKEALKIAKTFKAGFTAKEKSTIARAYEMFNNNKFYMSLGFDFNTELEKAKDIIQKKYKI